MKKPILLAVAVLLGVALPAAGFAASSWASAGSWKVKMHEKFNFAVENTAFGWTEIFSQPIDDRRAGKSVLAGIGRGLWNALGQEVGGALHLATFPFTPIDIPLPEGGNQLLNAWETPPS